VPLCLLVIILGSSAARANVLSAEEMIAPAGLGIGGEPRQVGDGLWFLGAGPGPSELLLRVATNVNAADTTNTDQLLSGGGLGLSLTGNGLTVGVWDAGDVRASHQEFGAPSRVTVVDGVGVRSHSTHVAGTIGAAGVNPSARGMASQVGIRSRDWTNDYAEMAADASLIVASNHSYSYSRGWTTRIDWGIGPVDTWCADSDVNFVEDPGFGKYDTGAQALDQVLHSNPRLLSVWAASNDRNDAYTGVGPGGWYVTHLSTSAPPGWYLVNPAYFPPPPGDGNAGAGYDCLPNDQVAKNTLVVGAINDITADPYNSGHVSLTSYSSWGPTDDGRVKPDVVGNGVGLLSSIATGDNAYASNSGTSMSAANVTGTAALLVEHYSDLFGSPPMSATTKGLLIHTAFDAGNAGPDYAYGWGLVDAAAAANFLTAARAGSANPSCLIMENSYSGTEWTLALQSDGAGPLKATLVWTDPPPIVLPSSALDDPTSALVNDLDLWITGPGGTHYPWTLDPTNPSNPAVRAAGNHRDNVEQVLVDTPAAGWFTIHVDRTGSAFEQDFSLLVSLTVPEPGTMLLLAAGCAALVARRRRRS